MIDPNRYRSAQRCSLYGGTWPCVLRSEVVILCP
jgi:hypothetical protein